MDENDEEKIPAFPVIVNVDKIIAVKNTEWGTCVYARGLGFKMHGFHYTATVIPLMILLLSKIFLVDANIILLRVLRSEWFAVALTILLISGCYYNRTYRYDCLYVTETVEEVLQKIKEGI